MAKKVIGSATSPPLLIPAIEAVVPRVAITAASVFIAIVIWLGILHNCRTLSLFGDRRSLSISEEVTAIQKLLLTVKDMMWSTHSQSPL